MINKVLRRATAKLLIAALLFMQMAVAAYACPGFDSQSNASQSAATADGMSSEAGCAMGDKTQPNLCRQHCQQGSQTLDQSLPAAILTPVLPLLAVVDSEPALPCAAPEDSREFLARTTAPPPSIRFCVFRI